LFGDIGFVGSGHGYHKLAALAIDFEALGDFVGGSKALQKHQG